jgi:hypothetical protein
MLEDGGAGVELEADEMVAVEAGGDEAGVDTGRDVGEIVFCAQAEEKSTTATVITANGINLRSKNFTSACLLIALLFPS